VVYHKNGTNRLLLLFLSSTTTYISFLVGLFQKQTTTYCILSSTHTLNPEDSIMASRWNEKQAKKAEFQMNKELESGGSGVDLDATMAKDVRGAAMGDGDEELFEKKLSKDEKKALAKAKRDAKKKDKASSRGSSASAPKKKDSAPEEEEKKEDVLLKTEIDGGVTSREAKRQALLDDLSKNDIVVTYEAKRGALHANTRDINASGVTVSFHGRHLIEETELVINYGNRYGFIGPNGSGKVRFCE
jgi:ATP-binding cassette subfamily F protein 2